jgi:hypothetical protein
VSGRDEISLALFGTINRPYDGDDTGEGAPFP